MVDPDEVKSKLIIAENNKIPRITPLIVCAIVKILFFISNELVFFIYFN